MNKLFIAFIAIMMFSVWAVFMKQLLSNKGKKRK